MYEAETPFATYRICLMSWGKWRLVSPANISVREDELDAIRSAVELEIRRQDMGRTRPSSIAHPPPP